VSDLEPPREEPATSAEDGGRQYPSTIGGAFYLVVLAAVAISIAVVTTGSWRLGIRCFGGALLFAAAVRAVLPAKDAGMLAVRQRWWDCFLLIATGIALLFLAGSIPDQPGL
jgi:predicted cobalt transporter CbtA